MVPIYVAAGNKGKQHTFIFLFWSQVCYYIIHVVRYDIALFPLQESFTQRAHTEEWDRLGEDEGGWKI